MILTDSLVNKPMFLTPGDFKKSQIDIKVHPNRHADERTDEHLHGCKSPRVPQNHVTQKTRHLSLNLDFSKGNLERSLKKQRQRAQLQPPSSKRLEVAAT
jgi:hypothetical protein